MQSIFTDKNWTRPKQTAPNSTTSRQAGAQILKRHCHPSFVFVPSPAYQAFSHCKSAFFGIVERSFSNTAQIILLSSVPFRLAPHDLIQTKQGCWLCHLKLRHYGHHWLFKVLTHDGFHQLEKFNRLNNIRQIAVLVSLCHRWQLDTIKS